MPEIKAIIGRGFEVGTVKQYTNGVIKIKTKEDGLIPLARHVAAMSDKVFGGGHELQPGERVLHLDMNSHGEKDHDRPENLVVVKWRTTKYQFLKASRILRVPGAKPAPALSFLPKQVLSQPATAGFGNR